MTDDPFADVMGLRRGADRLPEKQPAPPWWRWPPPHYARLSEWLDHVAAGQYVDLVLAYPGTSNTFLLRAYRANRAAGYALLECDAGEASWLEDHWPRELIEERREDGIVGRLRP